MNDTTQLRRNSRMNRGNHDYNTALFVWLCDEIWKLWIYLVYWLSLAINMDLCLTDWPENDRILANRQRITQWALKIVISILESNRNEENWSWTAFHSPLKLLLWWQTVCSAKFVASSQFDSRLTVSPRHCATAEIMQLRIIFHLVNGAP